MVDTPHKEMNFATTVVALVNGMIGGSILVLPLVALEGGWLYSLLVILFTGVFSWYSCHLSVIHLGDQKDLDHALLRHFNGSKFLKIFYDLCVWSGIQLLLMLYFELIVIQWQGLVPPYKPTVLNPALNAIVVLAWCLCLKFFEFGAHVMGYGIVSIVGYLLFLIWVVTSAPSGNHSVASTGTGIAGFAAMMGNAFSIQGFFIPVMKCYKNERKHNLILFLAFAIGGSAYYYIAFMGMFGIVNRTNYQNSQTIEGFFTTDQWQVKVLEGIYLIHLYSVFPQYLLVSKKRFFSMVGLEQSSKRRINLAEIIYIVASLLLSFIIGVFKINIDIIIDINGAVLGFCFVYFLPSILHVKCLYFPKGKRLMPSPLEEDQFLETSKQIKYEHNQHNQIELQQKNVLDDVKTQDRRQTDDLKINVELIDGKLVENHLAVLKEQLDYNFYYCSVQKPKLPRQIVDMTLLGIMFLMGLFIMIVGLIDVVDIIKNDQK